MWEYKYSSLLICIEKKSKYWEMQEQESCAATPRPGRVAASLSDGLPVLPWFPKYPASNLHPLLGSWKQAAPDLCPSLVLVAEMITSRGQRLCQGERETGSDLF